MAVWLLVSLPATPLAGQEDPGPLFDGRDAWTAAAYVGAAALAAPFDARIAAAVRDSAFQETPGLRRVSRGLDVFGLTAPLAIGGGLYGAGRLADRPDMADAGLHTLEAVALAEAITITLKLLVGRARPLLDIDAPFDVSFGRGFQSDAYRSFPSGHSTASFATAAALAHEMERVWGGSEVAYGAATYGVASLVGLSRIFDNRHWASDVVAGAAIGSFSGWKVVKYNHDHPDNRMNDWFLAASFHPGDGSSLRIGVVPAASLLR